MHAYVHTCDIFDMLIFISLEQKSISYTDQDFSGQHSPEIIELGQTLLVARWRAGISDLQKQPAVECWPAGVGHHGPLGDLACLKYPQAAICLVPESRGASPEPRAGPVLSGNIPVISRLLDSVKQTESAVGLDWAR